MQAVVAEVRSELMKQLRATASKGTMQKILNKALQRLHQCPCEAWQKVELQYLKHSIVAEVQASSSTGAISDHLLHDLHLLKTLSKREWDLSSPMILANIKAAILSASRPSKKAAVLKASRPPGIVRGELLNADPNSLAVRRLARRRQQHEVDGRVFAALQSQLVRLWHVVRDNG